MIHHVAAVSPPPETKDRRENTGKERRRHQTYKDAGGLTVLLLEPARARGDRCRCRRGELRAWRRGGFPPGFGGTIRLRRSREFFPFGDDL